MIEVHRETGLRVLAGGHTDALWGKRIFERIAFKWTLD